MSDAQGLLEGTLQRRGLWGDAFAFVPASISRRLVAAQCEDRAVNEG